MASEQFVVQDPREPADAFLRTADLMPEALLLVTRDGGVVATNRAAHRLIGTPGPTLRSLCTDADEHVEATLRAAFRTREFSPASLTLRAGATGALRCRVEGALHTPATATAGALALLRVVPADEALGRFAVLTQRIDQLTQEIAARRRTEATLAAERERLRVTLWSIGDAVVATDTARRVTFMNPVAQQLTGWPAAEALGRPVEEVFRIVHEDTRAPVDSPVERVLRDGCVVGLANHTLLVARDGSERPIDDSGAPVRDDRGRIVGTVLVFHDVSERNAMLRGLREQADALRLADRRKDEFLAMLAHELRNPLAPLANGLHVLKMPQAQAHVGAVLPMMQRQLAHLTRMLDDLLDVARITRGTIRLRREPMPLALAMRAAAEQSAPGLAERGQRLDAELPPASLLVDADAARLAQVFSNLLANAAKFSPRGSPVRFDWQPLPGDEVRVTVTDRGVGMPADLAAQAFDLFVQGRAALDRAQGGLGIGLTVVRALVEMHGGRVQASSSGPGQGSAFSVDLPLWRAAPPPAAEAAPH